VTAQRNLSAETIEHQHEAHRRARAAPGRHRDAARQEPVQIDWNQANFGQGPSTSPADVLGQWQKSQAGSAEAPAPEKKP
jgi:hypothetical protein